MSRRLWRLGALLGLGGLCRLGAWLSGLFLRLRLFLGLLRLRLGLLGYRLGRLFRLRSVLLWLCPSLRRWLAGRLFLFFLSISVRANSQQQEQSGRTNYFVEFHWFPLFIERLQPSGKVLVYIGLIICMEFIESARPFVGLLLGFGRSDSVA